MLSGNKCLYPIQSVFCQCAMHFTCMLCLHWLKQHQMHFLVCDRPVLDTSWDDKYLACLECFDTISELYLECALDDVEKFVFILVGVPDKFSLDLSDFDSLAVELTDDAWVPVVREFCKFFLEVDDIHNYCFWRSGADLRTHILGRQLQSSC